MNVYLIMNECTIKGSDAVLTEVVSVRSTLQKALDELNDIAVDNGDVLGEDETSIYVTPSPAFDTDEYYIDVREVDDDER